MAINDWYYTISMLNLILKNSFWIWLKNYWCKQFQRTKKKSTESNIKNKKNIQTKFYKSLNKVSIFKSHKKQKSEKFEIKIYKE